MHNKTIAQLSRCEVKTNAVSGKYRPRFFDLGDYKISKVDYQSLYFNESDVELALLRGKYSFAYLREDKLRTIDVWNEQGKHMKFADFLNNFSIEINSNNLFKTSKYLSRVFRPVRYGGHFRNLDVYINRDPNCIGKVTDGISLISLALAKRLGWKDAQADSSAQFTLFNNKGLIKGHCVVSDKIEHDVVIYGEDNIKSEINLASDVEYVALEPVKLSQTLRMDIQSLINLWGLYGGLQYLEWAHFGIEAFKKDLFKGKLNKWLDNFDCITEEDYNEEDWMLRKAIWKKVDYRRFPGLVRAAWTMFRSSLINYATDAKGNPTFRIPVPSGKRGYLRVDLREHDADGRFRSKLSYNEVEIDKLGNVWFSPNKLEESLSILGGADLDDSLCVVPIEENKAVIYRNPNQFGEYVIKTVKNYNLTFETSNKIVGEVPIKKIDEADAPDNATTTTGNSLLDAFLANKKSKPIIRKEYNNKNLLRTFAKISTNTSNIGVAANAEMILSSVFISNKELFGKLTNKFHWNLETIIDSTVKDGTDASEDMAAIRDLYEYIVDKQIPVPSSLFYRMPEKMRSEVFEAEKHPLDELLAAIKHIVKSADVEILGQGAVSSGNRIPGRIDDLDIPLMEIGNSAVESKMYDLGVAILKEYNKKMAIMLGKTNKLDQERRETVRKEAIDKIQLELLKSLDKFSNEERSELSKIFAYEIYKTEKAVHDSILWISDKDNILGTAHFTLQMLSDIGLAAQIKNEERIKRFYKKQSSSQYIKAIRLWSKQMLKVESFAEISNLCVAEGEAHLGSYKLNIGEECRIANGNYRIKSVVNSRSRKDNRVLKNSLTIYLA